MIVGVRLSAFHRHQASFARREIAACASGLTGDLQVIA